VLNRTEKGQIEIFEWIEERKLCYISLLDNLEILKESDYGCQVINIKLIKYSSNIDFMLQMRNGKLFICQYSKESNTIEVKLLIETGIETFTKFCILNLDNSCDKYKILYSSYNENELLSCTVLNSNGSVSIIEENKITLLHMNNINKNEVGEENEVEEEEEDKMKTGLVSVISNEKDIPFIVVALESSSNY
jgi:hypothetical protein